MGQGASSGQVVTIENRTPFGLRLEEDPVIWSGTEVNSPNEIPSLLQNESESPIDLRNVPNMHLENRGKHQSWYGSEIQYTYRFECTPNDEWFLKIWSIGAYKSENACFAARILKSSDKIFMVQTSWRNTATHGEHNPDKRDDIGTNADCFFQLSISAVTALQDKGNDFYLVPLRITMKPIVVANVISGEEVEVSRDVISTQHQTLLPDGSEQ